MICRFPGSLPLDVAQIRHKGGRESQQGADWGEKLENETKPKPITEKNSRGWQINEWVSHSSRAEGEANLGFRVCIWIYLGVGRGNSEPWCVFETPLPVGAPEALRNSRAQCNPSWIQHTREHRLRPICHTPPGCLQHDGSAARRIPGSGCRPPVSSLWGLRLPLGRN